MSHSPEKVESQSTAIQNFGEIQKDKTGSINGKKAVEAKNQTSKGWFVLAMVIGSLVVIGVGGFGIVGLIHSYGLHLPQWLQWMVPAIGTVGNTPHFWSLWVIAVSGVAGGGGLIGFGVYYFHKARTQDNQETKVIAKPSIVEQDVLEILEEQKLREKNLEEYRQQQNEKKGKQKEREAALANERIPQGMLNRLAEALDKKTAAKAEKPEGNADKKPGQSTDKKPEEQKLWAWFGDNFGALKIESKKYETLSNESYLIQPVPSFQGKWVNDQFIVESTFVIVIKTSEGTLQCTNTITQNDLDTLVSFLSTAKFTNHEKKQEGKTTGAAEKSAENPDEKKQKLWAMFGDNFATLASDVKVNPNVYKTYPNQTYSAHIINYKWIGDGVDGKEVPEDRPNRYFIVIKTSDGTLKCTNRITLREKEDLETLLKSEKYVSRRDRVTLANKAKFEALKKLPKSNKTRALEDLKQTKKGFIEGAYTTDDMDLKYPLEKGSGKDTLSQSAVVLNARIDKIDEKFLNSMFGDHFAEIDIDPVRNCSHFTNHTFGRYIAHKGKSNEYRYMVRKTSKGILQCTGKITVEQRDRLTTILKAQKEGQDKGYRDLNEKTT